MSDCELGKGGGKLIAIQSIQETEEIINFMLSILYQKKPPHMIGKEL
jgi:hypothetical protein